MHLLRVVLGVGLVVKRQLSAEFVSCQTFNICDLNIYRLMYCCGSNDEHKLDFRNDSRHMHWKYVHQHTVLS